MQHAIVSSVASSTENTIAWAAPVHCPAYATSVIVNRRGTSERGCIAMEAMADAKFTA